MIYSQKSIIKDGFCAATGTTKPGTVLMSLRRKVKHDAQGDVVGPDNCLAVLVRGQPSG